MSQITTTDPHAPNPDERPPGTNGDGVLAELDDDHRRLDDLEKEVRRYRISRDSWTFLIFGVAIVLGLAALVVGLWAAGRDSGTAAAPAGQTISASLSEYKIALSVDQVTPGSTITVTNTGTMAHNLGIKGTDLVHR